MAIAQRLNPSLFDKLSADIDMPGLRDSNMMQLELTPETMRIYAIPKLERFNEAALRATLKRDLAWLLNTVSLETSIDLDPFPQVKTSVVNYGVADLAGQAATHRIVMQRARDIRSAVRTYEPRISEKSLHVEPVLEQERENKITYIIHGDITAAVNAMPVTFKTDVEADTSSVTIRE